MRLLVLGCLCTLGPFVACATAEDVAEDGLLTYEPGAPDASTGGLSFGAGGAPAPGGALTSGGAASGGAPTPTGDGGDTGNGGTPPVEAGGAASGGTGAGGAASGGAGSGGTPGCSASQSRCDDGSCVSPSPANGCGVGACAPCPTAPANGYATCTSSQCTFDCFLGYAPSGASCQPEGGGAGGGGQGGAPTQCNASSCPDCLISGLLGQACCRPDGRCGCRALLGIFPCG